jgi:hypothetical protein
MRGLYGVAFLFPFILGCQQSGDVLGECDEDDVCETGDPVGVMYQARGVDISEVAMYQTVKIPLMKNGEKQSTQVGIIAEKEALFRVFVTPHGDFSSREIEAVLRLDVGAEEPVEYRTTRTVSGGSNDSSLSSTFNLTVSPEHIAGTVEWSMELLETEEDFQGSEGESDAIYPQEGYSSFLAESMGGPLRIDILPVRYNADSSGRLPDTSAARIDEFRASLEAMYPASTVEIRVLDPLDWSQSVQAYGSGWSRLLEQLYYERESRGTPYNTYLYGLFVPANSLSSYCSSGCVLGLSTLANSPSDSWARISIGLGFSGGEAIETLLHELGHAHGRSHAPCGTSDYDRSYPYSNGALGVWGYDRVAEKMKSPNSYADIMGYCDPAWISDYTYNALYDRVQAVNGAADVYWPKEVSRSWQTVFVGETGALSWGPKVEPQRPPGDLVQEVRVRSRGTVQTVKAQFAPYDHLAGGILLIPDTADVDAEIEFNGFRLRR